jgi:Esterase-like activity of phytase
MAPVPFTVERLQWSDEALGSIVLPKGELQFRSGFGSGLATRADDPPGIVWAIGDRGPNLKVETALDLYGLESLEDLHPGKGAKIMPRLDLGPAVAQLRLSGDRVELVHSLPISDSAGRPVSGLPVPGGDHATSEPALDLDGRPIAPDPSGLDTEGIVALADGGFWVGDEYGPSLVRLDRHGRVLKRLIPKNSRMDAAAYPVEARLPAIAGRRELNRGFEALALSDDEKWLFLAFQSPLAHPGQRAHENGRHTRLWRLDAETGEVAAQYLYPFDRPDSFRRDAGNGEVRWSDLKLSELCWAGPDSLLVLERGSQTTRIYRVTLDRALALPPEHLDIATRPTVEQLSSVDAGPGLPVLSKELVFNSDDYPEVAADLEGMAILSATELLLVNDNDFGVEGARTSFWLLRFEDAVFP